VKGRRNRLVFGIAIGLLSVVVLLFVLVLVVPDRMLKSNYIRSQIGGDPESGILDYDSASSKWPGTIHVKNLRFRDRDPKAEWAWELSEADLTYSLVDLLQRRFHVTRATGRGLVFHARNRLTRAEATAAVLRRIPPIAGFPDPPLLYPPAPKPPPTGKLWDILVENLEVDSVREIWIDGYRYVGDARLTGGFFLRPKERAEVFPATLRTRTGMIRSGNQVLADDLTAKLEARFPSWDVKQLRGNRVLRIVSGKAELSAQLSTAELLDRLLGEPPGTKLEKGSGRMNVRATVESGVAQGDIDYASRDLALRFLDVAMRGRFDGRMRLSGVRIENWGDGRLDAGHVRLAGATVVDRKGRSHPWWGRMDFARGEFRPKSEALFTTTAAVHARNAVPLLQVVRVNPPAWTQKLLDLDDALEARASIRIGRALVEVRRLSAHTGKLQIDGEYRAKGRSTNGTFLLDAGLLSVGAGISEGTPSVRIFGPRKWFRERTGWDPPKN